MSMKKSLQRSVIVAVIILLIFTVIQQREITHAPSYSISETEISFSPPSEYTNYEDITFRIADITELTLEDSIDFGECVNGFDTKDGVYGLWKSNTLGDYYINVNRDIDLYLMAKTDFITYVFNIESADTTSSLLNEILKLMEEQH